MVNYESVAATSATIQNLLTDKMESGAKVTISRPENGTGTENRVNLFLFQVIENKHLKNSDDSRLWLNLYYLLTPYGFHETDDGEDETQTQLILGDTMRVLHDYPIVLPGMESKKGENILDPRLKDSVEKIKITPHHLTLEELSNIWNPLKGDFRLSVGYQVSVIQIDSKHEKRYPAPVRRRQFGVIPFKRPEITEIRPKRVIVKEDGYPPTLTILGRDFFSPYTIMKVGDVTYETEELTELTNEKIKVDISPETLPGPHIVEVVVPSMSGKNYGFNSNQEVFILAPMIRDINISGIPGDLLFVLPGEPMKEVRFLVWDSNDDFEESGFKNSYSIEGILTKDLSSYSGLSKDPAKVQIKIGGGDFRTIDIYGKPTDLDSLRMALEAAIQITSPHDENYTKAAVLRIDDKLLILSGIHGNSIQFDTSSSDPTYSELELNNAIQVSGCMSENLSGFDGFSDYPAKLKVEIDGKKGNINFTDKIKDLDSYRETLEDKIQNARRNDENFNKAKVVRIDGGMMMNVVGTKLSHPDKSKVALCIDDKSIKPDDFIGESIIRTQMSRITKLEEKLPKRKCLIRLRVNNAENVGVTIDEDQEKIWFYDNSRPLEGDKIKSDVIHVEVFRNE